MAGNRNRKDQKPKKGKRKTPKPKKDKLRTLQENGKLYVERFGYDILSLILPLCGIPNEKLKSKERKKNNYGETNILFNDFLIVFYVAMSKRDEWKIMFESRFKSSGMGMIEKIADYLKSFLSISREFRQGNTPTKMKVSLAAYSEMMLFLNYKGIEFDFEQMIVSWTTHFYEHIAAQSKKSESLQDLFLAPSDPDEVMEWVKTFIKEIAIPYGRRNDVSNIFRLFLERQKQIENEKALEKDKICAYFASQTTTAGESDPILPPDFESPTVLPGNRESPEPPDACFTKIGVRGKDKKSKRRSVRPVVPTDFESLAVLPGISRSPETKKIRSKKIGARGKAEESKRRSVRPVVPPALDTLTVEPSKRESSEPTECSIKSGVRGKDKESRKPSTQSTDVTVEGRKPSMVLLEEWLRQMSVSNPLENKQKD